ncbi:MAG: class I SAM-dependent methyltransferase, partial [Chitinophagaceae bacterium]
MSLNSTKRFSDRVDNYIKYRTGYPQEIIPYLKEVAELNTGMQIADIGSGTGILTKLFLENGNTMYAAEPNDAMRNAAEHLLKNYSRFISLDGTAEQTGLDNESMDMIIAGQAFHWFDPVKTKKEFQRIAKTNSFVVLIWNE